MKLTSFLRPLAVSLPLLLTEAAVAQRPATVQRPPVAEPPLVLLYASAAQMPRLPNGASDAAAIETAIRQHLVYQPKAGQPALQAYDKGMVTFTIGTDGRVRDARVLPSELGPAFDKALLAATNQLPRFAPGRWEGQAVLVRYTVDVGAGVPYKYNREPSEPLGGVRMPPDWPDVAKWVPTPPRLPGGESLYAAVVERLEYPAGPQLDAQNSPMVSLSFTVDKTGRIVDLLAASSAGLAYDRAAVRALGKLPRFEPGRNRDGEPVPVRIEHSIGFPPLTPAVAAAIKAAAAAHQAKPVHQAKPAAAPAPASRTALATAPAPDTAGTRPHVYIYVEQMPYLPGGGGMLAVRNAIMKRLAIAEKDAAGCEGGKVEVKFTVEPTGAVSNVHIERGLAKACDDAVLAAVRKLPTFIPGMQNGEKVAVYISMPISFNEY